MDSQEKKVLIEDVLQHYASYMQELCESEIFIENRILFLSDFRQCAIRMYFLSKKIKKHEALFENLLRSFDLKTKDFPRENVALVTFKFLLLKQSVMKCTTCSSSYLSSRHPLLL